MPRLPQTPRGTGGLGNRYLRTGYPGLRRATVTGGMQEEEEGPRRRGRDAEPGQNPRAMQKPRGRTRDSDDRDGGREDDREGRAETARTAGAAGTGRKKGRPGRRGAPRARRFARGRSCWGWAFFSSIPSSYSSSSCLPLRKSNSSSSSSSSSSLSSFLPPPPPPPPPGPPSHSLPIVVVVVAAFPVPIVSCCSLAAGDGSRASADQPSLEV